ncbi:hypothetical protein JO41_00880 [Treponema sp. OMZ 838]|uniref:hypothetical protein n=1 Tax=Treponema sp. OMZ 838 TaxID=1539298 RepID=UPI00053013D1|nr:hypothetical protein [Treponema sp. OMZ 838]AIW88526.1 hypothetical protein JO41_00880 [Treponema sp. OMZ 838]
MIIIGKKKLIGAIFFSFALILATAIWGYKVGMQSSLKSDSELVLFFGFIGAGLELCLLIAMSVYAKRKENDFLMVAKAIQLNGVLSDSRAKKLGNLGVTLQESLNDAYQITAQKSLKIAGLNGLVDELLLIIDRPLLVVSLTGSILNFSAKAQEKTGCKQGDALSDIAPGISIKEAIQNAAHTRTAVQQDTHIVCMPVFSVTGTLSFFLVDLSEQPIVSKVMENVKHLIQKTDTEKNRKSRF